MKYAALVVGTVIAVSTLGLGGTASAEDKW
jgi:hypothetical protein